MVHLKWKDVQCLVLDFCDVRWDSGDIGWYWVTFWLIIWYWQGLTLNAAAAECHPMINSDLERFWASKWPRPRGRCRCWHWVTMEGKQQRSQVQRLQHIYSAPLSHTHTHTHINSQAFKHSSKYTDTQTHDEDQLFKCTIIATYSNCILALSTSVSIPNLYSPFLVFFMVDRMSPKTITPLWPLRLFQKRINVQIVKMLWRWFFQLVLSLGRVHKKIPMDAGAIPILTLKHCQ